MTTRIDTAPFGVVRQQQEIAIEAPAERVWEALTARIGEWWPGDYCFGGDKANFTLEGHAGGRLFEDWGKGEGFVWGHVSFLKRNEQLQIICPLTSDFGGPGTTQTTFKLEREGQATLLKLDEVAFGCVTEKTGESLDKGWKHLLGTCLKEFVEG